VISVSVHVGDQHIGANVYVEASFLASIIWCCYFEVHMKSVVLGSVLGATLLLLNGCGSDDDGATETIAELATNDPNLSTLVTALEIADLVSVFSNATAKLTVFAPNNSAFDDVKNLSCLLGSVNRDALISLLKYHVVNGKTLAKELSDNEKLESLDDKKILNVTIDGDKVKVNDASVLQPNIEATNGVVHVINQVLIPKDFAPSFCSEKGEKPLSLLDLAKNFPSFSTLVKALDVAELSDMFNGTGKGIYTVFAPTDDAFAAAVKSNTVDYGCLVDGSIPKALLIDLLENHVVGSYALSTNLKDGQELSTLDDKKTLKVEFSGDGDATKITVNKVLVTDPNNLALNGVVHQIDGVLFPEEWKCPTTTSVGSLVLV